MSTEPFIFDVIVLGSGPAGCSAGLYAARANLRVLCLAGPQPGGQLTTTNLVENYLGLDSVNGYDMTQIFRKHAEKYGVQFSDAEVIKVNEEKNNNNNNLLFHVTTSDQEEFVSKTVILATGASAKRLHLPNEDKYWNNGISACAVCDGFLFKSVVVGVCGGGDTACEEALHLARFACQVFLIHRGDKLRASGIMQKRVYEHPLIQVVLNTQVIDVFGNEKLRGVDVVRTDVVQTNEKPDVKQIALSGLFYAIGHTPNTQLLKDSNLQVKVDEYGYILTEKGSTRTNHPGVFACGDVQDKIYRQAITSAGSGCMSALDVVHFLQN
jgi:thioredoxin reductase (NADPH)